MPLTKSPRPKLKFHPHAYLFITDALSEAQTSSGRDHQSETGGHVSARELLEGVRTLGQRRFGMMATAVFQHWGISTTGDVGRIVFELIELGEMKKTDNDQFGDFVNVYSFDDAFNSDYAIDVSKAFKIT
ncbi:Minf_1886 family protein [Schlesneria paludicola]|uniref:Minf_1886 family protein n=1 Tax=Schlesneria paludicola TaxID=360056 RepID=UPI00029A944E|nr:Minf_1886 family protein [Schlesneria paludicola]